MLAVVQSDRTSGSPLETMPNAKMPSSKRLPGEKVLRVSGQSLVKRLLAQPDFADRLKDFELVPYGGRGVLSAVAKLVATAGTEGAWFYPLRRDLAPGGLPRKVVAKLGGTNSPAAEQQIESLLQALHKAELIEISAEGVGMSIPPLPVEQPLEVAVAGPPESEAARSVLPSRIGRPKNGESNAHFEARTKALNAAHQQASRFFAMTRELESQKSMMLPIAGGKASETSLHGYAGSSDMSDDIPAQEVVEDVGSDIDGSRAVAADIDSPGLGSESKSTAAIHSVAARAAISPSTSATDMSEVAVGNMEDADHLAKDLIRMFGWRAEKSAGIVAEVRRWFRAGVTRQDIEPKVQELHERHLQARRAGQAGIRSVNYLGTTLRETLASKTVADRLKALPPRATASSSAAGITTAQVDPRIAAVSTWAKAPREVHSNLKLLLDGRDGTAPMPWQVSHVRNQEPAAWRLFLAEHPEAHDEEWWRRRLATGAGARSGPGPASATVARP